MSFASVSELEALGMQILKDELTARGLKAGGRLEERAQRLRQIRGLDPKDFPANLLAPNSAKKQRTD